MTLRAVIAAACPAIAAAAAVPSASGVAAQGPAGQLDPGQLADQPCGGGERHRRGGPGAHLGQSRRHCLGGHAELGVFGPKSCAQASQ